jgi:predicted ATP-grasp superfamily ATP-dependent carboligase
MSYHLLIVGGSARALAASARRGGWVVDAIDLFGDRDLRSIARHVRKITDDYPHAIVRLAADLPAGPVCYTGAIENHPELIAGLARDRPLAGNREKVVTAIRRPESLHQLAMSCGWQLPPVRRSPVGLPLDGSWLRKPLASAAGQGIRRWTGNDTGTGSSSGLIWQRWMPGRRLAAALLLRSSESSIVGISRQILGGSGRFAYRGSVLLPATMHPPGVFAQLQALGDRLGAAGLVGLVGIDFLLPAPGERPTLVEVNPRFTASMELHERRRGESLAAAHLAACGITLLDPRPSCSAPRTCPAATPSCCWAKLIVRARQALVATATWSAAVDDLNLHWAENDAAVCGAAWPSLADLPPIDTRLPAGSPVLTVFACSRHPAEALRLCRVRAETVIQLAASVLS